MYGLVFYILLQIVQMLLGFVSGDNPSPPTIQYTLSFVSPSFSQQNFLKMMLNAEALEKPASWSNLDFENYQTNFLYLLLIVCGSGVFFALLTMYAWPFRVV
jgi:hypothetical protein